VERTSFDPQWLVENNKVGIFVLRIVRRAAQILTNSGCQVKVLELLLEPGAADIHNFLLHTQLEVEPMAGIAQGNLPKAPRNQLPVASLMCLM
jgi:hypothetical protein